MKAWLWQFLSGYVKIKVEGLKLLQFLNEAAAHGIAMQSTDRESYSRLTAVVSWRDYRRLVLLARGRPLRVTAAGQGGLPYIGQLALKRLAFTVGLILCVAALVAVNRFVLEVRVSGCSSQALETKVTAILTRDGLQPGAEKNALDLHAIEKDLTLELPEISFAAIRVNGVVAEISVVEGEPAPKLLDKDSPCDIVAGRDGVVRKLIAYEGQPQVAPGDTVRRGQLLVGSAVTLLEGVKKVHARADVLASVWYEARGTAALFEDASVKTGAVEERRSLEFAGMSIPVGKQGQPEFQRYETEENTYYLLGDGLKGPRFTVTRYYEVRGSRKETSFEDAKKTAQVQALEGVKALLPQNAEILDSRTVYDFTGGSIIAKVYIETLENIAVEQPG